MSEEIQIIPKGRIFKINKFETDDTILIKKGEEHFVINYAVAFDALEISMISQGELMNQAGVLVSRNIIEWCKEHGSYDAIIDPEIVKKEEEKHG